MFGDRVGETVDHHVRQPSSHAILSPIEFATYLGSDVELRCADPRCLQDVGKAGSEDFIDGGKHFLVGLNVSLDRSDRWLDELYSQKLELFCGREELLRRDVNREYCIACARGAVGMPVNDGITWLTAFCAWL